MELLRERRNQDRQHGQANRNNTLDRWMVILGEEFGEACQAQLSAGPTGKSTDKSDLRKELVQVAAVAMAIIERLDADGAA